MKRDIFISHRHEDKQIADVLRDNLLAWGISEDRIFQSSGVRNAPQIGGTLQAELQNALHEASVLFFIFTSSGADWSWCIYEIGLATDPEISTRIVVLKCTDDPLPTVVKDQVVIDMTRDGLQRLVKQFHMDDDFFPDQPPFSPGLAAGAMKGRGEKLFDDFIKVIPPDREREIIRWGSFLVGISPDAATALAKASLDELLSEDKKNELMAQSKILAAKGLGIQHFGYSDFQEGLTLSLFAERWIEEVGGAKEPPWAAELSQEFWNVATNRKTTFRWVPFKSLLEDLLVCPVVTSARKLKNGGMEFEVFMFYFEGGKLAPVDSMPPPSA